MNDVDLILANAIVSGKSGSYILDGLIKGLSIDGIIEGFSLDRIRSSLQSLGL
ncbi:Uncharacterised protein [uncultured archaeon]|nr:Uncharacterised protein [uncultured archaeon]